MDRNRQERLYDALGLIVREEYDIAISVLQKLTVDEVSGHNREGLARRSNSFLNGAIKNLHEISEFEPPIVNVLNADGQKRWSEVQRKRDMAIQCLRTVIETEGGRRFLEGKHAGLMLEGFPGDNGMERRFSDRMSELEKAMLSRELSREIRLLSREIRLNELVGEFMEAMTMRDAENPEKPSIDYSAAAEQSGEPAAGDGAADRREPEYLLEWARSTNGKKHGVWKKLFMSQAFRDDVKAMAKEQEKMAPVLKAYWDKHKTLQGKGSFDSFRKGFGYYPKCRDMFPK